MSEQTITHAKPTVQAKPQARGILQRQCACGQHTQAGEECEDCRKKGEGTLQRRAVNQTGQDEHTFTERPSGHDFSHLRVHSNENRSIQTKLTVNEPGDQYEQEADRVAEQVMRMPETENSPRAAISEQTRPVSIQRFLSKHNQLHRQPEDEEGEQAEEEQPGDKEEETLQAKEAPGETPTITPEVQTRIDSIRGAGQPLPESTRTFMESRFGHDFSQVRVHADTGAAETACAVRARAFTLGHDIVFGSGAYTPATSEGKKLLAHELTHVVQQDFPAYNKLLIQRKNTKQPQTKSTSENKANDEIDISQLDIPLLIEEITATIEPYMDKVKEDKGFNVAWEPIAKRISSPKLLSSPSTDDKANYPDLYKPEIVDKIKLLNKLNASQNALNKKKKKKSRDKLLNQVLNGIVQKLAESRTKITHIDYKKEYDELLGIPSVPGNISGGLAGYISGLRDALMEKFCNLERIKQYYREEIIRTTFLDQPIWVHKDMAAKLKIAESLLSSDENSSALANVKDIGGLEIRANVNRKKTKNGKVNLSKHSYGWAIDIRAYTNPNVPNFPRALVKEFTGEDFSPAEGKGAKETSAKDSSGQDVRAIRAAIKSEGKTKVSLEAIQHLSEASKHFKEKSREVFKDENSLRDELTKYLQKEGDEAGQAKATKLVELYKKVYADELAYKKAEKKEKKELKKKLDDSYNSLKSWISNEKNVLRNHESEEFMLEVYDVYAGTRDEKGEFQEVAAQIIGSAATIASQGFIDLPPELIKALIDSGLDWLGVAQGVKDFMHFQLHQDPASAHLCEPAKVEDAASDK